MKVIIDVSIVPIGVGTSVSKYVAKCQDIINQFDVEYAMHGYGTNIEGEWDEVMKCLKECHIKLHEMGVPRITDSIRLGTRIDKDQTTKDKIRSVEEKLKK